MAHEVVDLTDGLYRFMLSAEQTLLTRRHATHGDAWSRLLARAETLSADLVTAKNRTTERLSAALDETSRSLRELVTEMELRRADRDELRPLWEGLSRSYEGLVQSVRLLQLPIPRDVKLGALKPRNLWRNGLHAAMGLGGVLVYELVLGRTALLWLASSVLAFFCGLELIRRRSPVWNEWLMRRVFGRISRPSEAHRVPAAVWYMAALVAGVLLLPQHAIELGVLTLAVGDPIASLAGKRWGHRKLINDKSLAGSTAFLIASALASLAFVRVARPDLSLVAALLLAGLVALAGAITEVVSTRVDDNFTIPLLSGVVAALLLSVL